MAYSDLVVQNESGGDANATNPNSSASGLGQFINSTWVSLLRNHRPDLADGKSDADLIGLKSDPDLNKQMIDAYASDNSNILSKNGIQPTPGNTYLAHFAGPGGAVSVLKADPSASAASILGPQVAKANPFLQNMTAGDLVAWASRKMGTSGAGASTGAPQAASAPTQGVLAVQTGQPAAKGPGILNSSNDDGAALQAFQGKLAQLLAQQQQAAPVAPLAPIQMAVPKGISRARLLAALSSPIGG
jgi:hypothetical protein